MTGQDFPTPVVAWRGSSDPAAPLVVLLHGRGADENGIVALADHLPTGPAYAAVCAPIAADAGYAWFANRGIGRPVAESIGATIRWFRAWLDEIAPPGRPVAVVGISGGAAFGGGLVLDDPRRSTAAAILYGTMPFDAGLPTTAGRLVGIPLLVQQGDQDAVIPRELLDRTWAYLTGPAGAACTASRYPARATDLAAPEASHGLPQQESTAVPMSLNSDDFDEKGRPALHAGRPESRIIVARDHSGEVRCFNERFPTRTDDLTAWCQCAASKAS